MDRCLDTILELCSAQQAVIKRYEEYIDRLVGISPIEEDHIQQSPISLVSDCYKVYTVPEVTFMLKMSPEVMREWNMLKANLALPDLETYLSKIKIVGVDN